MRAGIFVDTSGVGATYHRVTLGRAPTTMSPTAVDSAAPQTGKKHSSRNRQVCFSWQAAAGGYVNIIFIPSDVTKGEFRPWETIEREQ